MSNFSSSFETFSPSYQNISNRMSRLKRNGSSQSYTNIKSNSVIKKFQTNNVFAIESYKEELIKPKRKLSPNLLALTTLKTEYGSEADKIITGRVTKNNGLKKYNQRQLKEVIDVKKISPDVKYRSKPLMT